MFWKKKPAETKAKVPKKPKAKKLSPKEIMINQIEQLSPGQSLTYQLAERLWAGFAGFIIVELNPQYPQKGRRYIISTDKIVDGKPAGQKKRSWDSDKAKQVASWILEYQGVLFSWPLFEPIEYRRKRRGRGKS